MSKRYRRVKAKPGELKVAYGKGSYGSETDLFYAWGEGVHKGSANVLSHFLEEIKDGGLTLRQELQERGFDITTLKFSIQKLPVKESSD